MLLSGTVSVVEAKSSICKATAYKPIASLAVYRRLHWVKKGNYNMKVTQENSSNHCSSYKQVLDCKTEILVQIN